MYENIFNTSLTSTKFVVFLQGVHHKEATKILKLVVTRSSTLVAAPSSQYSFLESHSHYSSTMCPTFADVEVFVKKELPGRNLVFRLTYKNRTRNFEFPIIFRSNYGIYFRRKANSFNW